MIDKKQLHSDAVEGINRLRKHLNDFEKLLDVKKDRVSEEASKFSLERYPEEQQYEICSSFAEEEFIIDNYIATFHYRAIFLLIYAWFEHLVQRHFDLHQYNSNEEKNNGFFDKFKKALKQNGRKDIINCREWQIIALFYLIRNLITHTNSSLEANAKKKKDIEKFVKDNPDKIEFDGPFYWFGEEGDNYPRDIKIKDVFCEYTLSILGEFFNKVSV
jgi:hypothetical protein